jgi:hypothetical protein
VVFVFAVVGPMPRSRAGEDFRRDCRQLPGTGASIAGIGEVAVKRDKLILDGRARQATMVPAAPEVEPPGAAAGGISPRIHDVTEKARRRPGFLPFFWLFWF